MLVVGFFLVDFSLVFLDSGADYIWVSGDYVVCIASGVVGDGRAGERHGGDIADW